MSARLILAGAILACLAAPVQAGGAPGADPVGETLEEWQALICGPAIGERWDAPAVERSPDGTSGTLHVNGLWHGGWVDGFDPRAPDALFAPRPFLVVETTPDHTTPGDIPGAQSPAAAPIPLGGTAWFLLAGLGGLALLRWTVLRPVPVRRSR